MPVDQEILRRISHQLEVTNGLMQAMVGALRGIESNTSASSELLRKLLEKQQQSQSIVVPTVAPVAPPPNLVTPLMMEPIVVSVPEQLKIQHLVSTARPMEPMKHQKQLQPLIRLKDRFLEQFNSIPIDAYLDEARLDDVRARSLSRSNFVKNLIYEIFTPGELESKFIYQLYFVYQNSTASL